MRVSKRGSRLAVAALFLSALTGCGSGTSGPATVEVFGTVTLNGSPVEGANVVFYPGIGSDDGRLPSQAVTGSDGRYRLSTHIGGGKMKDGIVPGKYDVSATKLETAAMKTMLAPPKNLLPPKYADAKTSQLKADVVAAGKNDFPLVLKSD